MSHLTVFGFEVGCRKKVDLLFFFLLSHWVLLVVHLLHQSLNYNTIELVFVSENIHALLLLENVSFKLMLHVYKLSVPSLCLMCQWNYCNLIMTVHSSYQKLWLNYPIIGSFSRHHSCWPTKVTRDICKKGTATVQWCPPPRATTKMPSEPEGPSYINLQLMWYRAAKNRQTAFHICFLLSNQYLIFHFH